MYTALTRIFLYDEVLVRCLPVQVLGLTLTPLSFSEKTVKYIPVGCAVILFSNSIIALHCLRYLYGIDSLFDSVCTLTRCIMLPSTVHVCPACIGLFADGPSLELSR